MAVEVFVFAVEPNGDPILKSEPVGLLGLLKLVLPNRLLVFEAGSNADFCWPNKFVVLLLANKLVVDVCGEVPKRLVVCGATLGLPKRLEA